MKAGKGMGSGARLLALGACLLFLMGWLSPFGLQPPPGVKRAAAAADPYEPNDSLGEAYGPLDRVDYEAYIQAEGDHDFFFVDVPERCKMLRATLTGIPESCNYELRIYNSSGESIAGSENGSNQDEFIEMQNPAEGRYYVEVWPYEDYSDSDAYTLGIRRSDLVLDHAWEKVGPSGMSPPLADYTVGQVEAASASVAYAVLDPEFTGNGKVLKTTDYGDSWQVIGLSHPDPSKYFNWTEHISVVSEQVVWVGSTYCPAYGVARTEDGGNNWAYSGNPAYMHALLATDFLHAWDANYYSGAGCIHSTADGGATWSEPPEFSAYNFGVYDIHRYGDDFWAVGSHYNNPKVLHRVPGPPVGWATVDLPPGLPASLDTCWNTGGGVVWAAGSNKVIKTTNGGQSWSVYTMPSAAGSIRAICALSADTAYVAGSFGTILRTMDGGENWDFMFVPTRDNLLSVHAVDAEHAWASGEKGVLLRMVPANTRTGSDVTVDLGEGDTVTFTSVTAPGNTYKVPGTNPTYEELPDGPWIVRDCREIETTASYQGTIEVRMPIGNLLGYPDEGVRMFKKTEGGSWEDVTWAIDTVNHVAIGRTDSLSEFVLGYLMPDLEAVTPTWGIRGQTCDATLEGHGFWETSTAKPYVALQLEGQDDIAATDVVVESLNRVTCRFPIPADAVIAKWDVYIQSPDHDMCDTLENGFRVMDPMPPPTVTSVSPSFAERGTKSLYMTINGSGFWGAWPTVPRAWLSREGQPDIEGRFSGGEPYNATELNFYFDIPADACSGAWDVKVMNPDGKVGVLTGGFTITGALPPPTVTSITPNSGAQGATVAVTNLAGTGFYGTPSVRLKKAGQSDIVATGVTVVSPTKITCSLPIPAGAATGAWDVVVKNPDNQEGTLPGGFTVTAAGGGGNTPPGSNVQVDLGGGLEVTFSGVSGGGNTSATPQPDPSVANFHILGSSCYDIATTATYEGNILVTLPYDEDALIVPESSLRMLHQEGGTWVDVTESVDTANDRITGMVTSLSQFVIAWKAANVWYLAEGCTALGMQTYVLVQNPNQGKVYVDITFMTGQGEVQGPQNVELPGNSRCSFLANAYVPDNTDVSTRVTSEGGDIICERAMYGPGMSWAHDSIGVTAPSSVWYLAEGCTALGMQTYVLVQNPNQGKVYVDITFMTGQGEVQG
ncbi:DUF5719 family protein, partial [Candidatus Solincola tengchongensis]|uniref:DUF5719 family protein n=1 Tax=Candidatus Solincola tengchongensis TaxID=2900693 RepID=UPI00258106F1